jgi:hypothetical protein
MPGTSARTVPVRLANRMAAKTAIEINFGFIALPR